MARKFHLKFNADICKGCELCGSVCPKKIISMSGVLNLKGYITAAVTDEAACIGCLSCATMCPDGAIEIFEEE